MRSKHKQSTFYLLDCVSAVSTSDLFIPNTAKQSVLNYYVKASYQRRERALALATHLNMLFQVLLNHSNVLSIRFTYSKINLLFEI